MGADVRATKKVQKDVSIFSVLYCCSVTLFELLFPLWCGTGTAAEQHTVLSEGRPGSLQENVQ